MQTEDQKTYKFENARITRRLHYIIIVPSFPPSGHHHHEPHHFCNVRSITQRLINKPPSSSHCIDIVYVAFHSAASLHSISFCTESKLTRSHVLRSFVRYTTLPVIFSRCVIFEKPIVPDDETLCRQPKFPNDNRTNNNISLKDICGVGFWEAPHPPLTLGSPHDDDERSRLFCLH